MIWGADEADVRHSALDKLPRWAWIALLAGLGVAIWLALWSLLSPHSSWDALFYHSFAAGYAGASDAEQAAYAWDTFAPHADPEYVAWLQAHDSWPWQGWEDPMRQRWILQYQMRPLYPVLVAAAYPTLGTWAPVAVSLFATCGFVIGTALAFGALAGRGLGLLTVIVTVAIPEFSMWLPFLQTDGLGIALYAVAMGSIGLYVKDGRGQWLVVLIVTITLLALARPLVFVVPAAVATCAAIAYLRRDAVWHRFAAATLIISTPIAAFVIGSAALGFPSFADLLQDLPTRHFSQPDVANPWGYVANALAGQIASRSVPTLFSSLWAIPVLAIAAGGFWLGRPGWWSAPLVAAIPFIAATYAVHPSVAEFGRTIAPAWLTVGVGMAISIRALLHTRERRRFGRWISRTTTSSFSG